MTVWAETTARLRRGDLPQLGLLALAIVGTALVASWPARAGLPHEGWYVVAQTRSVVVALLALGYGTAVASEAPRQALATVLAVLVVAASTLPLELVAHGASAPATPAWWAWVATPVAVVGHVALGAGLGAVARVLRLGSLLFLLVPAVVVGAIALDVRLGATVFNPLTVALQVAPGFLVAHAALTALGAAVWLVRSRRRPA